MRRKNEIILIYAGGLDEKRGIHNIIKSLDYLPENVELWLLGEWASKEFKSYCESFKGFRKTRYWGKVSMNVVYKMLIKADIGLVLLKKLSQYEYSLPIKFFEYMAAGLAIVSSDFEYWKRLFSECSLFADPDNPKDIASKIKLLIDNPELRKTLGNNGKRLVEKIYNWESESRKLLELYDMLCKG